MNPKEALQRRFDHFCKSTRDAAAGLNVHLDALETTVFARQLEYIFAQSFNVEYPELKGRTVAPVNYSVGTGAEAHTYRQFDQFGEADYVVDYSDEFPNGELLGKEFTAGIVPIGASYIYSVQDLRAAQMTGFNLTTEKANLARGMIETKLDRLIAFGDTKVQIGGFLKDKAGTAVGTAVTSTGTWTSANVDADHLTVITDIQNLIKSVWVNTQQMRTADTLLVSTKVYAKLQFSKLNQYSDESLLTFLAKTLNITIIPWLRLDAQVDATHDKIVAYSRRPEVLSTIISQEFEQFAPQQKNLSFMVPCHLRCGGVVVRYPKAISYMSILNSSL